MALVLGSRVRELRDTNAATPQTQPAAGSDVAAHRHGRRRRPLHTTEGDEARYERYRDARDGVYSSFSAQPRERFVSVRRERACTSAIATSGVTQTSEPQSQRGVPVGLAAAQLQLSDEDALRHQRQYADARRQRAAAVQGPTIAPADGTCCGVPCAPGGPPASCSTPALAAQALANRSIYNSIASVFDLRQQRDTAAVRA